MTRDPSADHPVPSLISAFDEFPGNLRVGIPRAFFFDDSTPRSPPHRPSDPYLRQPHTEIRDIKLEVPTDRTLASAEAYAYHKSLVEKITRALPARDVEAHPIRSHISCTRCSACQRELQASRHTSRIFNDVMSLNTPFPIPPPKDAELKANPTNASARC